MDNFTEQYNEYLIEINSVPEDQFDFDDFGWAFQVFKDGSLYFRVIIKTAASRRTEANKSYALNWGKEKIHALIDTQTFGGGTDYCYEWIDMPNNTAPQKVNCEGFLWQKD